MARTPAESQKLYRERLKAKKEQESRLTITSDVFKRPFWQAWTGELEGQAFDFSTYLEQAGMVAPEFLNNDGPEVFAPDHYPLRDMDALFPDRSHGSLLRAEEMVGSLKEAAEALAKLVHDYKHNEIKARLAEIEASDLSAPETKKAALKEAARLNKMLDQLEKQVRITFPQWKVTG